LQQSNKKRDMNHTVDSLVRGCVTSFIYDKSLCEYVL